jgi:hypothetical protein
MTQSANYDATKEDSRAWRTDQDSRASTADAAAYANGVVLQTATQDTNPITAITPDTTTCAITAAAGTTHTKQITTTGKIGTVVSTRGFQVTYASSSTGKATVSSTGLITGVAAGTATVTVTAVHDTSITTAVVATVS